ncbi:hypothetical protein HYH03_006140 [Edaphochlamys debaryana]|uniref:Uncharacterized protein n=1 Tax=Edaphochlamys debaryana TaxID=47281 RepID=A0A835Y4P1_9CHLO|nr:hypothetical protein HYH03_006140 [Edaphochlamys debaryana]|eukprot:KAG2495903.1 hypothetical protein HYH03_006140 [Edaphochlamys debaryana]
MPCSPGCDSIGGAGAGGHGGGSQPSSSRQASHSAPAAHQASTPAASGSASAAIHIAAGPTPPDPTGRTTSVHAGMPVAGDGAAPPPGAAAADSAGGGGAVEATAAAGSSAVELHGESQAGWLYGPGGTGSGTTGSAACCRYGIARVYPYDAGCCSALAPVAGGAGSEGTFARAWKLQAVAEAVASARAVAAAEAGWAARGVAAACRLCRLAAGPVTAEHVSSVPTSTSGAGGPTRARTGPGDGPVEAAQPRARVEAVSGGPSRSPGPDAKAVLVNGTVAAGRRSNAGAGAAAPAAAPAAAAPAAASMLLPLAHASPPEGTTGEVLESFGAVQRGVTRPRVDDEGQPPPIAAAAAVAVTGGAAVPWDVQEE